MVTAAWQDLPKRTLVKMSVQRVLDWRNYVLQYSRLMRSMSLWLIFLAMPNTALGFGTATMVGLWLSLENASLNREEDQSQ